MSRRVALLLITLAAGCSSAPVARLESDAGAAQRAARHAAALVGKPYRYGGASPAQGFDCSGLIQYSYRQAGVSIPRSTEAQLAASRRVSRAALRSGDLVFFDQDGKKKSHVGLYIGSGQFVHAPSSGKFVRKDRLDSPYWTRHLSDLRRI